MDKLQLFPNQTSDHRPFECAGETVADIIGNIYGIPMDPGFSYAAGIKIEGVTPTDGGEDPSATLDGAICYGALPKASQTFDALSTSALYEANFANYSAYQKVLALKFAQKGKIPLRSYQDICNYIGTYKAGVSLSVKWYASFNTPNQDGVLPAPSGPFTYHDVAVYEAWPGELRLKPWLGPDFGDHGYAYISPSVFNLVFVEAFGFDLNAWRWLSLVKIALSHPSLISDILPQLSQ